GTDGQDGARANESPFLDREEKVPARCNDRRARPVEILLVGGFQEAEALEPFRVQPLEINGELILITKDLDLLLLRSRRHDAFPGVSALFLSPGAGPEGRPRLAGGICSAPHDEHLTTMMLGNLPR